ncbi:hypothetical protein [Sphingopyxis sp. LK2115]|jgi:hypothetical protein|uniref:hypothetical protein n=1 Tax=Sphingopyxis sp. LK2115 TaxID=2744558 RepID=UPI0016601388|nr:hypothetical protein [Sphingopyxis sp. LK2115]
MAIMTRLSKQARGQGRNDRSRFMRAASYRRDERGATATQPTKPLYREGLAALERGHHERTLFDDAGDDR